MKIASPTSISLVILATLAVFYTAYIAQDIILLLMVTGLTSLLLSPGVRLLNQVKIPRPIGALLLLMLLIVPSSIFISQLQEPISRWAQMLPQLSAEVSQQIEVLDQAIESTTKAPAKVEEESTSWFSWFDDKPIQAAPPEESNVIETRLKESLFVFASDIAMSAPMMLIQIFTTLILILFTLIYSPQLFQQYLRLFVSDNKRDQVSRFAIETQKQLSRYILTVSLINITLAAASIIFFYAMGLQDALLLGTFVGLLNFIPYVGPLIALGLIAIGGLVQWGGDANVLIVLVGTMSLNVIESQFVTPLILAKNMRINPFLIILCLLITAWMWGLVGVIIAVPMLVCIKLMLAQSGKTKKWVAFLAT